MNTTKQCNNCKEVKPHSAFTPVKGTCRVRSQCRSCRSKISSQQQMEKRKSLRPFNYIQCIDDNCNLIWPKSKGNFCRKCGCKGEL